MFGFYLRNNNNNEIQNYLSVLGVLKRVLCMCRNYNSKESIKKKKEFQSQNQFYDGIASICLCKKAIVSVYLSEVFLFDFFFGLPN